MVDAFKSTLDNSCTGRVILGRMLLDRDSGSSREGSVLERRDASSFRFNLTPFVCMFSNGGGREHRSMDVSGGERRVE